MRIPYAAQGFGATWGKYMKRCAALCAGVGMLAVLAGCSGTPEETPVASSPSTIGTTSAPAPAASVPPAGPLGSAGVPGGADQARAEPGRSVAHADPGAHCRGSDRGYDYARRLARRGIVTAGRPHGDQAADRRTRGAAGQSRVGGRDPVELRPDGGERALRWRRLHLAESAAAAAGGPERRDRAVGPAGAEVRRHAARSRTGTQGRAPVERCHRDPQRPHRHRPAEGHRTVRRTTSRSRSSPTASRRPSRT